MDKSILPAMDTRAEKNRIASFLKNVFIDTGKREAVIGWSGGIDSTVSLFLLSEALPKKNIHVLHLPYETSFMHEFEDIQNVLHLPNENIEEHPIKSVTEKILEDLAIEDDAVDKIRIGNIMARYRMITLFDKAREIDGLVCGTENRSEHMLGYFTRFGDGASDIEPIIHLYKTQIYELARYLGVPAVFLQKTPTAGLWNGQTDEGEFGFTYKEADAVIHLYTEQKQPVEQIEGQGYLNARKIISYIKRNDFKHRVPYYLT